MSSIDLALAVVALMGASPQLSPAACPASDGGVPLSDGTVYDGPVVDNAILAPDTEQKVRGDTVNSWPVAYVYRAGRRVTLSCRYAGRPAVVVSIARPVKICRYTSRGTVQSLACR